MDVFKETSPTSITCKKVEAPMTDEEYKEMSAHFWNAYPDRKNKQGYPLNQCRFEPDVKDFVFVPMNYGNNTMFDYSVKTKFCKHCMLRPCITVEYNDEVSKICSDMWSDDNQNYGTFDLRDAVYDHLARSHCVLFQKQFIWNDVDLPCVSQYLEWSVPLTREDKRRAGVRNRNRIRAGTKGYQKKDTVIVPHDYNFMSEWANSDIILDGWCTSSDESDEDEDDYEH